VAAPFAGPSAARAGGARVKAFPRPPAPNPADVVTVHFGKGMIDLPRREVRWPGGNRMELSETETALLQYLVNHRQRAVTREELLERVWGITPDGLETRTVDIHLPRLQATFKDPTDPKPPEPTATV